VRHSKISQPINDRLHCGKTAKLFVVPSAVNSIAELDLKRAILPDCSGNAPIGERSNGHRHRKTPINLS
jgi:hypothetical protein